MMETVFSVGSAPRLYNENARPAGRRAEEVWSLQSKMIEKRWHERN
jgi:hypothetical protein